MLIHLFKVSYATVHKLGGLGGRPRGKVLSLNHGGAQVPAGAIGDRSLAALPASLT